MPFPLVIDAETRLGQLRRLLEDEEYIKAVSMMKSVQRDQRMKWLCGVVTFGNIPLQDNDPRPENCVKIIKKEA